jgi:uncharacterized protein YjiS (DUF1127 family)
MTVIPLHEIGGPRVGSRRGRYAPPSVAHRVVSTLREWRRRARDRSQLAQLDDRMLRDIGLTRADAEFLSNRPFWQE